MEANTLIGKTIGDTMSPGEPENNDKCSTLVHHGRYISRSVLNSSEYVNVTHSSDFHSKKMRGKIFTIVVSKHVSRMS